MSSGPPTFAIGPDAATSIRFRSRLQCLTDGIMEGWTYVANQLAFAIGPGAICEQDDGNLGIEVDPQGASAESEVPNRVGGEVAARGGVEGGGIPAECSRTSNGTLPLGEYFKG